MKILLWHLYSNSKFFEKHAQKKRKKREERRKKKKKKRMSARKTAGPGA